MTGSKWSRRKSSKRAKLKVASKEEKLQKWKEHFKNLLGNPLEIIDNDYQWPTRHQNRIVYGGRT